MSRRAAFNQADVTRAVRGALAAGLPAGSFSVEIGDGLIRLLPVANVSSVASPADDGWDKALTKWRRSA